MTPRARPGALARALSFAVACALWCGSLGCAGVPSGWEEVPRLDPALFAARVQPVLRERCSNPSCHARAERPFALFAPGARRIDPSHTFLFDLPLTALELARNFEASRAFAAHGGAAEEALLLRKPLAAGAGTYHGGGTIFDDRADRGYRALLEWIERGEPR